MESDQGWAGRALHAALGYHSLLNPKDFWEGTGLRPSLAQASRHIDNTAHGDLNRVPLRVPSLNTALAGGSLDTPA